MLDGVHAEVLDVDRHHAAFDIGIGTQPRPCGVPISDEAQYTGGYQVPVSGDAVSAVQYEFPVVPDGARDGC
eukprot:m.1658733 g.1658733  ORF g.1658733 m.1658733 type:complete len:72 (+) comp117098_c0_seq1:500-715(+)